MPRRTINGAQAVEKRETPVNRPSQRRVRNTLANIALGALAILTLVIGSFLISEILTARRVLEDEIDPGSQSWRRSADDGDGA